ncbi:Histidine protein methyltransferase 1 [Pseudocercospora fuligena]|uniref:protein-histidine N-methyltransferase n=1 Tax=Pseudocercospora fuligena TaxID=685502 RepID=A0A8H6RRA5_9PEZI|nr:Histidine protein methyltransferase 1 [Pseudocercospora fuligena]
MAFSFGFSADDADSDVEDAADPETHTASNAAAAACIPAKLHKFEDLVASLPERLSYSTVRIESPLGKVVSLPRRELFDVKAQLLQEDQLSNDHVIDQLEKSDLRSGVYEGGFKTWECSLDLASLLLDRGPRKDIDELIRCDQIVELGAGSALPSLVLFRHALINGVFGLTFTLADYNEEVLRLITLPNLFLTWAAVANVLDDSNTGSNEGDLEVTPELVQRFQADLQSNGTSLNFISGPWSTELAELIPMSAPEMGLVVLAAETIYSPDSTVAFVDLLSILLRRVKMAKAMIGAKRMYFGVGGSVDGLKEACREKGAVAYEIENHGVPGMDGNVPRALIEVQMY